MTSCSVEMDPTSETFVARLDDAVAIPINSWSDLAGVISAHGVNQLQSTVIAQVRWLVAKGDRPLAWPLKWVVTGEDGEPLSDPTTVTGEPSAF